MTKNVDKECGQEFSCKYLEQLRHIPQLLIVYETMGVCMCLVLKEAAINWQDQSLLKQQRSTTPPRHCPAMPCPTHQQVRDSRCLETQCWQERVQAYVSTAETMIRDYRDFLGAHMCT